MNSSQTSQLHAIQISDEAIAKCFAQAIDAYDDPNQTWGIPSEVAIDAVRELLALQSHPQIAQEAKSSIEVVGLEHLEGEGENGPHEASLMSRRFVSQRC